MELGIQIERHTNENIKVDINEGANCFVLPYLNGV